MLPITTGSWSKARTWDRPCLWLSDSGIPPVCGSETESRRNPIKCHNKFSSLVWLFYIADRAKFSFSAPLLTDDKSMGVTQHSNSSSIHCCYSYPVLFSWLESRDVKVVLATIHCPVLIELLFSLHTPHLEKQFACWRDLGSLMLPLSNT